MAAWAPPGWSWRTDEHGHIVLQRTCDDLTCAPAFSLLAEAAFLARVACSVALASCVVLIASGAAPADLLSLFSPLP